MRISIAKDKLINALQFIQNAATTRGTQIMQNALFAAQDGRLQLTATDSDICERCSAECEVHEDGQTTLPLKRILSIAREMPEETIEISSDEQNNSTLSCGSCLFRINGLPARDFPVIPVPEANAPRYVIEQKLMKEMFNLTQYATAKDDANRRALTGVLMEFKDGKLTVVSTDSRRMAIYSQEVEFPPDTATKMVVPGKTVGELVRALGEEGVVEIYHQNGQIVYVWEDKMISSKLIDESFPNYHNIIPRNFDETVEIDREQFLGCLRRVATLATTVAKQSIRLTFSDNQLTVRSQQLDLGEGRDSMPVKYAGKEINIIFFPEFLMDVLKAVTKDTVIIEITDGHNPAVIKCEGIPFLYFMMPQRLN